MKLLLILLLVAPFAAAATLQEAQDAYFNATLEVQHMKRINYPTQSLEDALTEMHDALVGANISVLVERANLLNGSNETEKTELAQKLYQLIDASLKTGVSPGVNYTFVVEKAEWIVVTKQKAFESSGMLAAFNQQMQKINQSELNLSAVHGTISKAENAFKSERYDDAIALVRQAQVQLENAQVDAARERAFLRLARRNVINYVREHWLGLLVTLIIVGVLGAWSYLEARLYYGLRIIRTTKFKLSANQKIQEETQKGYYADGMGSQTYNSRMGMLKQKQRQLKTRLQVWEKLVVEYRKYSVINRFRQS
jgi:hypothetical protein